MPRVQVSFLALMVSLLAACLELPSSTVEIDRQGSVPGTDSLCREPNIAGSSIETRDFLWMQEAWKQFVADGRYCVPGPQEFRIPEAAKTDPEMKSDLEGAVKHPYGWGDFNKDHRSEDFVAFVIDKTREPPDRFGIVIFHQPGDRNKISRPYWVFKDQDLSRSRFDGGSGIFLIRTYFEDGSSKVCYVKWNPRRQSYSCQEKPRE